jgi:hypothetical protein
MNTVSKKHQFKLEPKQPQQPLFKSILLFITLCCTLGLVAYWEGADFLEMDETGQPKLAPPRQQQMEERLKRLQRCEQYVISARISGYYPCYNCEKDTTIFLHAGEVWKYGVTIQGVLKRYRNWLVKNNLRYRVQYRGTVQDCLIQETLKIYQYPLLPENLKRKPPLIRPPGNKNDL